MTTARETDIMRVESKFYLSELHRKWVEEKIGKRAKQQEAPQPQQPKPEANYGSR